MTKKYSNEFQNIHPYTEDDNQLPITLPNLPEADVTALDSLELVHSFWLQNFTVAEMCTILNRYSNLTREERKANIDLRKRLKEVRKVGLLLKSALYFYNQDGEPKEFAKFMKTLGKLNDTFGNVTEDIYAPKLLLQLTQHDLLNLTFNPTDNETYQHRFSEGKNRMRETLEKPDMTIAEYHDLRKDVRNFKSLYQIAAAQQPESHSIAQTFHYLNKLSSDLGKIHDQYAILKLTARKKYETTTLELPQDLKIRILNFLDKT